jgi:chromosome segregation ATPase
MKPLILPKAPIQIQRDNLLKENTDLKTELNAKAQNLIQKDNTIQNLQVELNLKNQIVTENSKLISQKNIQISLLQNQLNDSLNEINRYKLELEGIKQIENILKNEIAEKTKNLSDLTDTITTKNNNILLLESLKEKALDKASLLEKQNLISEQLINELKTDKLQLQQQQTKFQDQIFTLIEQNKKTEVIYELSKLGIKNTKIGKVTSEFKYLDMPDFSVFNEEESEFKYSDIVKFPLNNMRKTEEQISLTGNSSYDESSVEIQD